MISFIVTSSKLSRWIPELACNKLSLGIMKLLSIVDDGATASTSPDSKGPDPGFLDEGTTRGKVNESLKPSKSVMAESNEKSVGSRV